MTDKYSWFILSFMFLYLRFYVFYCFSELKSYNPDRNQHLMGLVNKD